MITTAPFPQFADSFVIVIDGDTPETAEATQRALYESLKDNRDLYSNVFAPGLGNYFETNAFLLQSTEDLLQISDDLAAAQPVLAAVSEDQSLRGLFGILNDAMDETLEGEIPNEKLPQVLKDFTQVATKSALGQPAAMSWQSIFLNEDDLKQAKRRLDFGPTGVGFHQIAIRQRGPFKRPGRSWSFCRKDARGNH